MPAPALLFCALLLAAPAVLAQTVGLAGTMGERALLMVDGSAPKGLAPGEGFKGVKLVSVRGDTALVDIGGKQVTLRVGEAPAQVGGSAKAGGNRIVLQAGSGGHFTAQGQINGKAASMVVDTGASLVSISTADAERLGLDYRNAEKVQLSTANGVIPAWRIKLDSVQLGDVLVYNVDSVVSGGAMPFVLLGNSFLSRFQMSRTNDQMVLEKRY